MPIVQRPIIARAREIMFASMSLLIFGLSTALLVAAWFARSTEPWTWRAMLAMSSSILAIAMSFVVWRFPSRPTLFLGLLVLSTSLLRINYSADLNTATILLIVFTLLFCAPLLVAFGHVD